MWMNAVIRSGAHVHIVVGSPVDVYYGWVEHDHGDGGLTLTGNDSSCWWGRLIGASSDDWDLLEGNAGANRI
jgi:hypothetical protein